MIEKSCERCGHEVDNWCSCKDEGQILLWKKGKKFPERLLVSELDAIVINSNKQGVRDLWVNPNRKKGR